MNGSMHELHIRMQCIITFQSTKKSHAIHGYILQVKYLCSIKYSYFPSPELQNTSSKLQVFAEKTHLGSIVETIKIWPEIVQRWSYYGLKVAPM